MGAHPAPGRRSRGRARTAARGRADERRPDGRARPLSPGPHRVAGSPDRRHPRARPRARPGVEVETDIGTWSVIETPGHAPSHVCLHQAERRLLVSGDHLLGRISLFYDHGHTPDPVAEFIASLDVVDELDIRLCLPGHGRTFRDVAAKIAAYRKEVDAQLGTVRDALRDGEKTPFGVVEAMLGEGNTSGPAAAWALQLSLAYLDHLEALGEAERTPGTDPVLWRSTG